MWTRRRGQTEVPSVNELTSENSASVWAVAETMKSVTVSAVPAALSSVRSARTRVMSTATVTVNWGTVVALRVSRSAITRRILLICRGAPSSGSGTKSAGDGGRSGRSLRRALGDRRRGRGRRDARRGRQRGLHVAFGDAAFRAGAGDGSRIDPRIGGEPARSGADSEAGAVGPQLPPKTGQPGPTERSEPVRGSSHRCRGHCGNRYHRRGGHVRNCLAGLADVGANGVDRYRLAFLDDALEKHALVEGFDVHIRLVCFDLEEHVAFETTSPSCLSQATRVHSSVIWPGFGMSIG